MSQRSGQQNRALHKWFSQIADTCQQEGIDAKALLSTEIEHRVTPEFIKCIWHHVQESVYGKKSTAKLEKHELDIIIEAISKHLGEQFGIYIPFPNDENK